jgi:hypothetical protein
MIDNPEARFLREQADKCRRLANSLREGEPTRDNLTQMAQEFDARADEIELKRQG